MGRHHRLALLSGMLGLLASCGRFDYQRYPIDEVEVASPAGRVVAPGAVIPIEIRAYPGPFVSGTHIHVTFELGQVRVGDTQSESVGLSLAHDGTTGPVSLVVPLSIEPGRILRLTSSAPLVGDLEFEVREPELLPASVAGNAYEVHESFELDAPVAFDPAVLVGRAERLATPAAGSALGEDLYVALSRPPALLRVVDGSLEPFAELTDPARADDRVTALTFPLPGKGYEDHAYLCTSNPSGLLAIDATGASAAPVASMPCTGLVFDHEMRLDYDVPFPSPLYFTDDGGRLGRVDSTGNVEILGEGLPVAEDRVRMLVCPKDFVEATTILLSPGAAGLGADGAVIDVHRLVPMSEPQIWLDGLAEPEDAAFTQRAPYGWLMFVALAGADEVVAVRRDGSQVTLLRGISEPAGLWLRGEELWVLGRGRGELVRIRPRATP